MPCLSVHTCTYTPVYTHIYTHTRTNTSTNPVLCKPASFAHGNSQTRTPSVHTDPACTQQGAACMELCTHPTSLVHAAGARRLTHVYTSLVLGAFGTKMCAGARTHHTHTDTHIPGNACLHTQPEAHKHTVQCSQTHHLHRAHSCGSGAHGRPCRAHEAPAHPKPPIWGLRPVPAEPGSARIAPKPTWGGCVCPKCARGMCECAQACAHPTAGLSSHPSNAFSVQ